MYILKKIVGSNNFSVQFNKIIYHYKMIGFPCGVLGQVWCLIVSSPDHCLLFYFYIIDILQQTACLVVNLITVGNFAFLFNCTLVGPTSGSMTVPT